MEDLKFRVGSMVRNFTQEELDEIYSLSYNGIMIAVADHDEDAPTPLPWDAGFSLMDEKANTFRLTGGMGPGGFGHCEVQLPLSKADSYYTFMVEPHHADAESRLKEILRAAGCKVFEPEVWR